MYLFWLKRPFNYKESDFLLFNKVFSFYNFLTLRLSPTSKFTNFDRNMMLLSGFHQFKALDVQETDTKKKIVTCD